MICYVSLYTHILVKSEMGTVVLCMSKNGHGWPALLFIHKLVSLSLEDYSDASRDDMADHPVDFDKLCTGTSFLDRHRIELAGVTMEHIKELVYRISVPACDKGVKKERR